MQRKKINIKVGIPTPWGASLTSSEFKYQKVDMEKMLSKTHLCVSTSSDNYRKTYRFHLVPFKNNSKI